MTRKLPPVCSQHREHQLHTVSSAIRYHLHRGLPRRGQRSLRSGAVVQPRDHSPGKGQCCRRKGKTKSDWGWHDGQLPSPPLLG